MQGIDTSTIVSVGMMLLLLLAFIVFTLWQRLEKPGDKGLDLETYERIKERHERLAKVSREQKEPFGGSQEGRDGADFRAD